MRNFLDDSIVEHKSKPPLRWIANWAGSRASAAVMRSAWLQEDGVEDGFKQFINERIYMYLWPIYHKYGTFYKLDMDLSGPEWDDYDSDGIPYWGEWDFEDPETGDAFRVINFGGKE